MNAIWTLGHTAIKRTASGLGSWNNVQPDVTQSAPLGVEALRFGRIAAMIGVTLLVPVGAVGAASGGNYFIQKVARKFAGEFLGKFERKFFEGGSIVYIN